VHLPLCPSHLLPPALSLAARDARADDFARIFGASEPLACDFPCALLRALVLRGHGYASAEALYFSVRVTGGCDF
jgi:hypothetical protein